MEDKKLYDFGYMYKRSLFTDEDVARFARQQIDNLADVHALGVKEALKTDRSKDFTPQGRAAAFRKLSEEMATLIKPSERVIAGYGNRIRQVRERLTPKPHDRNDLAWQLEKQEVRNHLRSMDPAMRLQFITEAIERGDQLVMEAVLYSPIPDEFGLKDLTEKIRAARIDAQFPEESAQIRELERAQQELVSALGAVRADLARRGLDFRGDAVSQADAA